MADGTHDTDSRSSPDETRDALIVFTPSGKRGRVPVGTPVLQAARQLGVDLDSVCGGRGICSRCQITPSFGEFSKHGIAVREAAISAWNKVEERYKSKRGLAAGRRLGCQATIQGDLVIDVPPESQVHRQVVRKRAEVRDIELNPVTRLYFVEVEEPDMHKPLGDLERVYQALEREWALTGLTCDLRTVQALQRALRAGDWKVTVAVHTTPMRAKIIAVWPGFHQRAFGVAIDIGSTTIAAHLTNLSNGEVVASAGLMNPQIRFGEDLMSRVSYVMMNPGGDGEMTEAVREAINALIGQVVAEAHIDLSDVLEAVFVGNPIMHHLLLGIDPTELGGAPFALATGSAINLWATEIGIRMHPDARIYVLPCIAGHVGADTAGVILSETPYLNDELTLIVDVGTNAEIVLGNRHRLLAASSPTGPAFEGAQISAGQRAAAGAIERVRIDPVTLEPRFKVIGCDLWSDESGFAAAVGSNGVTGICGSGIIEVIAEMYLAQIITPDGVIRGELAGRSPRIQSDGRTFAYQLHAGEPEIRITQNDVRAIQLAKAALYAGCRLLMDHMGVDAVERVTLAGAFGSHIDPTYAMILGLIPDCDAAKVSSAGNAAGTGARIALLNADGRAEIEQVVARVEKIETAVEPKFQAHFVDAMAFPHKRDPFPNLAKIVALPARVDTTADGAADGDEGGRRRRRRRGGRTAETGEAGLPASPMQPVSPATCEAVEDGVKLFASAAERNREPILAALRELLPREGVLLEVASGTGQHAAFMAPALAPLVWQPSDINTQNRRSIAAWTAEIGEDVVRPPLDIDVSLDHWPISSGDEAPVDAILAINLLHIAPWFVTEGLLRGSGRVLAPNGRLLVYGPFKRDGEHTAPSNAEFDEMLRAQDATWGVRDVADIRELGAACGLAIDRVIEMPANNLMLVLRRAAH